MDFLSWFALVLLIFTVLALSYGMIAIHDIPYNIAKKRHHPHAEAIHYGGWISLFTLHAIWPFLWIWATVYHPKDGYAGKRGGGSTTDEPSKRDSESRVAELEKKIATLEADLSKARGGRS